jgi:hypothetical protein
MIISYYIQNDQLLTGNDNYLAFKSIHENIFLKEQYRSLKGIEFQTNIFSLEEELSPFINDESVLNILKELDIKGLPIVIVDNNIVKIGDILLTEELSNLLDLGISFQS